MIISGIASAVDAYFLIIVPSGTARLTFRPPPPPGYNPEMANPFRYPHDPWSWAAWCSLLGLIGGATIAPRIRNETEWFVSGIFVGALAGAVVGYVAGRLLNRRGYQRMLAEIERSHRR